MEFTKLTRVLEKLTDLAKGVERLRTASSKLAEGRYAAICRELKFASDSLDDIPERDGLCALLKRVEAEVGTVTTGHPATRAWLNRGTARKATSSSSESYDRGRTGWPAKFGDVIAHATGGKVTLERLKNLTGTDAPVLEAALTKLVA